MRDLAMEIRRSAYADAIGLVERVEEAVASPARFVSQHLAQAGGNVDQPWHDTASPFGASRESLNLDQ